MKATGKSLAVLSLLIVMIGISCKKWEEPGNGGGKGGGGNTPITYKLSGMFKDYTKLSGCKWVFEAKDGKKYEVATWPSQLKLIPDVAADIEMKYSQSSASACMVGAVIDIISINYMGGGNACKQPVKANNSIVYNTVSIQKVWQEGNFLKMQLAYSGCNFDPTPIDLFFDGNIAKTNPASVNLKLINQPKPQACEAYFTAEKCFDISPFKSIGKTLIFRIDGYKEGSVTINF